MVSEKQKQILLKNGFTETAINTMSYEEVSNAIGKILSKKVEKAVEKVFEVQKAPVKASNGNFHLSIEQVRSNAVDLTLKLYGETDEISRFWSRVEVIENYLLNGVFPK